jgi:glycosyltransferase involved in cell wall biosynthesis
MAESDTEIGILLASYNGERFISDQLNSLLAQTYIHWQLFIRDDGSTDKTVSIINKYIEKDKRIHLLTDNQNNLGSCENFATLLNITRGQFQYIMFCDQDDFWLPAKIEETILYMKQVEEQQEKENAVLVYTNFSYADIHLKTIPSRINFQTTKLSNLSFAHLLAQNPAYGCTMMLNRQLADLVKHIPVQAENHDYWTALVASALGKIVYLNKPTVLYRQHDNNISTNYNSNSLEKRLRRIVLQRKNFEDVRRKAAMALAFKDAYYDFLSKSYKQILNEYISLFEHKSLRLLVKNIRNGVRRQTLLQTILFYASILLLRKGKKVYEK